MEQPFRNIKARRGNRNSSLLLENTAVLLFLLIFIGFTRFIINTIIHSASKLSSLSSQTISDKNLILIKLPF